jgi:tRNA (guanine37-N1)-methyltransferase
MSGAPAQVVRIDVVTIFPDYLTPLRTSIVGKAIERGQLDLAVHDLRSWTTDAHHTVDDTPYGGGAGMVMLAEPWGRALDAVAPVDGPQQPRLVVPTPSGRPFTQAVAAELARQPWLVFACGRYEGIDARVLDYASSRMDVDEISIGDYVLCGGEAAVLVMIEAFSRLIPGVLGNAESIVEESFADVLDGGLEAPAYTKPPLWRGYEVPPVLLSGNHGEITKWRRSASAARTQARRPDLVQPESADGAPRQ